VTDNRSRREALLAQPCTWCGRPIRTVVTDVVLLHAVDPRECALAELDHSRAQHLTAHRCATAGHDPGDEDAGEDLARFWWRPA
jgi:hypothetical protein